MFHNASQNVKVAAVVTFYMSAALVMVFVNKAVLISNPDLPLLYLLNQLIIAVILLHGGAFITSQIEIPKLDPTSAKKLFPVVSVNIIGLAFNTLCLRGVEASFFQIARGLVLPFTIAVSCIHTHVRPSLKVFLAAFIVTIGFLAGITPNSSLPISAKPSFVSLIYGVLSSVFIAVHAVLIKSSLPYCNNSTIQLAYWTNLGSALMLAPFIILNGELFGIMGMITSGEWDAKTFVWGSVTTGIFGFLLCVAGLLSIKITSPITHMFSSAARSVLQTLLGIWLFSDVLTANRAASIFVICLGTMYYTWVKSTENSVGSPTANGQKNEQDIEAGRRSTGERGLKTIFEAKEDGDESVMMGQWTNGHRTSESADRK